MKKFISLFFLIAIFTSCEKLGNSQDDIPEVTTSDNIVEVTATTATLIGEVVSANGVLDFKGFCWSVNPNPTFSASFLEVELDDDPFIATIEDLSPSTQYYVRAFASSENGVGYGEEITIVTEDVQEPPCTIEKNTLDREGVQYSYNTAYLRETISDLYEITADGSGIGINLTFKNVPITGVYKVITSSTSTFDMQPHHCYLDALIKVGWQNRDYYANAGNDVYVEKTGPNQYEATFCDVEMYCWFSGQPCEGQTVSCNLTTGQ